MLVTATAMGSEGNDSKWLKFDESSQVARATSAARTARGSCIEHVHTSLVLDARHVYV